MACLPLFWLRKLVRNEGEKSNVVDGWGYTISSKDLREFFDHNPGIKLCFIDTIFIDVAKDERESNLSTDDVLF